VKREEKRKVEEGGREEEQIEMREGKN